MDAAKLAKINEYEHRIKTLTKTLAVWYVPVFRACLSKRS